VIEVTPITNDNRQTCGRVTTEIIGVKSSAHHVLLSVLMDLTRTDMDHPGAGSLPHWTVQHKILH